MVFMRVELATRRRGSFIFLVFERFTKRVSFDSRVHAHN